MSAPALDRTAAVLDPVSELVSHLRWRTGELAEDELACDDLAADPDRLWGTVAATAEGRGSDDPQVLGSLWFQAYAYRVAGMSLAAYLCTGEVPDAGAGAMGIGIARARPSSVTWLPTAREPTLDLEEACARLFGDHLDRVADGLRARVALGEQLLWGDCAAGCASATGAVTSATVAAGGDPAPMWDRVERFLAAAPHGLDALGAWTEAADGPAYRRNSCCLWYKTTASEGRTCEDCSLRSQGMQPAPPPPESAAR